MRFPRGSHLHRDSELNSPRSRDETSSPCTGFFRAVIQALELDVQLEGGSGILRALSYYYYNDYAAVAALAGASFENVANMTRPDPCAA